MQGADIMDAHIRRLEMRIAALEERVVALEQGRVTADLDRHNLADFLRQQYGYDAEYDADREAKKSVDGAAAKRDSEHIDVTVQRPKPGEPIEIRDALQRSRAIRERTEREQAEVDEEEAKRGLEYED